MGSWILLAIVIIVGLLWGLPRLFRWRRDRTRRNLLRRLEQERSSRVITLIHRQEGSGLFGLAFGRYIDIDDSEQLLRAIRLTPDEMPIDLLLHTPGGLVLASDQIAYALKRHAGRITVIVPHYAMSGGTLVALAADQILMDPDAVLGPVDPQLGSLPRGSWPAASILKALEQENPNRDDETLILGDVARKAIDQVHATVEELLAGRFDEAEAKRLASLLSEGRWPRLPDPAGGSAVARTARLRRRAGARLPAHDALPAAQPAAAVVEFIPTPYRTRGHDD